MASYGPLLPTLQRALGAAALALVAASCSRGPTQGPVPIVYDRDRCEHCQMLISDPRYAAEIRLAGDLHVHKFDDLGGALAWLGAHALGASGASASRSAEIWVRDAESDRWLDATRAWYSTDAPSPMRYGFAAHAKPIEGGIDFEEVRERLERIEAERRSAP